MTRKSFLRLPWTPVETLLSPDKFNRGAGELGVSDIARLTGIPRARLHSYMQFGVPTFRADLIASRAFGVHPSLIWEDWFETAELEPQCRWCGDPCPNTFDWCSPLHRRLHQNERKGDSNRKLSFWRRLDRYRQEDEEAAA